MIAANLDAFAAALAKVGNENRKQAAAARGLLLQRAKHSRHIVVGYRQLLDDAGEFRPGRLGDFCQSVDLIANDILEGQLLFFLNRRHHARAGAVFDALKFAQQLFALGHVADVVDGGRLEHGADLLRSVRQGGVGAGGDALHALGAILRDIHGRLAPGHIL